MSPRQRRLRRKTLSCGKLALVCGVLLGALPGAETLAAGRTASTDTLGTIGAEQVTEAQVIGSDPVAFETLQREYDNQLHHLQQQLAQKRYELLRQHLDALLDRRALELEASSRGKKPEALLEQQPRHAVTDEELRQFYDANAERIQRPYEAVAAQMREYVQKTRDEADARQFYDALRGAHRIASLLPPYRVAVEAVGPARGPANAPVTIIEFGDFQCPYCRQAEATLRSIREQHPSDVRLVFRHLPLKGIHPQAQLAATAGVCADRQGKFWAMHDAMYANPQALGLDALKATAGRLGADSSAFESCLGSAATRDAVDLDVRAAEELGIGGTPYFFVNGRPLNGNVPVEQFEDVIRDELRRGDGR